MNNMQGTNTLFLGNGLNLLSGAKDWNTLLSSISYVTGGKSIIDDVPNTLQYESIMLDTDYKTDTVLKDSDGYILVDSEGYALQTAENTEQLVKEKIAGALSSIVYNKEHGRFLKLPFEHIITTNYDDAIAQALSELGLKMDSMDFAERLYSIRRHATYKKEDEKKSIHYIHGDIHHPNSIMLGLDHYCGSVSKIDDYIKGQYEISMKTQPDMISKLKEGIEHIVSWIDLFFTSNIYFVGFGLDYSETDIWYILNKRKRYIRQYGNRLINNRIIYLGEIDQSKKQLLESLDVEVYPFSPQDGVGKNYPKMYDEMYNVISNLIN